MSSTHSLAIALIVSLDKTIHDAIKSLGGIDNEDVDPVIRQLDDARGQIRTFMCTPTHNTVSPNLNTEHKTE